MKAPIFLILLFISLCGLGQNKIQPDSLREVRLDEMRRLFREAELADLPYPAKAGLVYGKAITTGCLLAKWIVLEQLQSFSRLFRSKKCPGLEFGAATTNYFLFFISKVHNAQFPKYQILLHLHFFPPGRRGTRQ